MYTNKQQFEAELTSVTLTSSFELHTLENKSQTDQYFKIKQTVCETCGGRPHIQLNNKTTVYISKDQTGTIYKLNNSGGTKTGRRVV